MGMRLRALPPRSGSQTISQTLQERQVGETAKVISERAGHMAQVRYGAGAADARSVPRSTSHAQWAWP